jgi:hypothetical protein
MPQIADATPAPLPARASILSPTPRQVLGAGGA